MDTPISRRDLLKSAALGAAALVFPPPLLACGRDPDRERLAAWSGAVRSQWPGNSLGRAAIKVGELAIGTPYEAGTLDRYLKGGVPPSREPLTLSLTRFDCVTLVEACLAVARIARAPGSADWESFGREIERMRYRGGVRRGYVSRLHYFSEWITDGEERGLMQDRGAELGGMVDDRPLRFMTQHRSSYPALADTQVFREIAAIERRLDRRPRRVIPSKRLPEVVNRIESGDVLGFATEIGGLDVSHAAFAYRNKEGTLRVLHAPLSGGLVEVTRTTLPEYVAGIRRCTGVLVARPLVG